MIRRHPAPLHPTPRRVLGAALCFLLASGASQAQNVCDRRLRDLEIPAPLHRPNDIPYFGENRTVEARSDRAQADTAACGRENLYFRQLAFTDSFDDLRGGYLEWLAEHLTGPDALGSAYVRNHGVKITDRPGEFRFVDAVKPEPDHQGRLEIHLTDESGGACRQVVLRYSAPGRPCAASPEPAR